MRLMERIKKTLIQKNKMEKNFGEAQVGFLSDADKEI